MSSGSCINAPSRGNPKLSCAIIRSFCIRNSEKNGSISAGSIKKAQAYVCQVCPTHHKIHCNSHLYCSCHHPPITICSGLTIGKMYNKNPTSLINESTHDLHPMFIHPCDSVGLHPRVELNLQQLQPVLHIKLLCRSDPESTPLILSKLTYLLLNYIIFRTFLHIFTILSIVFARPR